MRRQARARGRVGGRYPEDLVGKFLVSPGCCLPPEAAVWEPGFVCARDCRPPCAGGRSDLAEGSAKTSEDGLARRLSGLVSIKGEDLLLQATSDQTIKYHRLCSGIPSRLWKWKEVAGWSWNGSGEHINKLEMRAALTTVMYWILKRKLIGCKLVHLTDSLVVLHSLRTIMRINALLLAANLHPVWTYIHTSQNPADRPSRRVRETSWNKMGKGQQRLEGRSQRERQEIRKLWKVNNLACENGMTRLLLPPNNSLEFPRGRHLLDGILCQYLAFAAVQDACPWVRGSIPGAWRLLKACHVNELPNLAPPLPERVLTSLLRFFHLSRWTCYGSLCWLCSALANSWASGMRMLPWMKRIDPLSFLLSSLKEANALGLLKVWQSR